MRPGPVGCSRVFLLVARVLASKQVPNNQHLKVVHKLKPTAAGSTTEPSAAPTEPHRPSSKDLRKTLTTGSLQLNSSKCLPSPVHAMKAPVGWTVRHNKSFALLGHLRSPGLLPPQSPGKVAPSGETHGPTRPSPVPGHGHLVLLRFCFNWCQISYHARAMPDSIHFCAKRMQASLVEVPGRNHPASQHPGVLAL